MTQSCVKLTVILFKRICVNILISTFVIQFIEVGYINTDLINTQMYFVNDIMSLFLHSNKMIT